MTRLNTFISALIIVLVISGSNLFAQTTQLEATYCESATPLTVKQSIVAEQVMGATKYIFEFNDGGTPVEVESTDRVIRLEEGCAAITYNATVQIRVRTEGTAELGWGNTCIVNVENRLCEVRADMCGATLLFSDPIWLTEMPCVDHYEMEIIDANDASWNKLESFNQMYLRANAACTSFKYGHTYNIRVRTVELAGGAPTQWSPTCTITMGAGVPAIRASQCDMEHDFGSAIYADGIGCGEYVYELTDLATSQTTSALRPHGYLRFNEACGIANYGKNYTIRVKSLHNGEYSAFSDACNISTPAPVNEMEDVNCTSPARIFNVGSQIFCKAVSCASLYEFQFSNANGTFVVQNASNRMVALNTANGFSDDGSVYDLRVRTTVQGIPSEWGPVCQIQMEGMPGTKMTGGYCNQPGNVGTSVNATCETVPGATEYIFYLNDQVNPVIEYHSTVPYFKFMDLCDLGIRYGTTYHVTVATDANPVVGESCTLTYGPRPSPTMIYGSCADPSYRALFNTTLLVSEVKCATYFIKFADAQGNELITYTTTNRFFKLRDQGVDASGNTVNGYDVLRYGTTYQVSCGTSMSYDPIPSHFGPACDLTLEDYRPEFMPTSCDAARIWDAANGGSVATATNDNVAAQYRFTFHEVGTPTTNDIIKTQSNQVFTMYSHAEFKSCGQQYEATVQVWNIDDWTPPGNICVFNMAGSMPNVSLVSANAAGDIDISVTGGTAPINYQWVNDAAPSTVIAATEDVTGFAQGSYTAKITDVKGCAVTQSVIIAAPTTQLSSGYCNATRNMSFSENINCEVVEGATQYTFFLNDGTNPVVQIDRTVPYFRFFDGCATGIRYNTTYSVTITTDLNAVPGPACTINYGDRPLPYMIYGGCSAPEYRAMFNTTLLTSEVKCTTKHIKFEDAQGNHIITYATANGYFKLRDDGLDANGNVINGCNALQYGTTYQVSVGTSTSYDASPSHFGTACDFTLADGKPEFESWSCDPSRAWDASSGSSVATATSDYCASEYHYVFQEVGSTNPPFEFWQANQVFTMYSHGEFKNCGKQYEARLELKQNGVWTGLGSACIFNMAGSSPQASLVSANTTGDIDISVSGGTSPYTYQWVNDATPTTVLATTQDVIGVGVGEFTATIADAATCSTTQSATIAHPTTQLSSAYCNSTVPQSATPNIYCDAVAGASTYTFHLDDGLNPVIDIVRNSNFFRFFDGCSLSIRHGATYSVTVTTDLNNSPGNICSMVFTGPQVATHHPSFVGASYSAKMHSSILVNVVTCADMYYIKYEDLQGGHVITYKTTNGYYWPDAAGTNEDGTVVIQGCDVIVPGTAYKVSVAYTMPYDQTISAYGPLEDMTFETIPSTNVSSWECTVGRIWDATNPNSSVITAKTVYCADEYEYEFTNTATNQVYTYKKNSLVTSVYSYNNDIKNCGQIMDVRIRAWKGTEHGDYGSVCQMQMAGTAPTVSLATTNSTCAGNCDAAIDATLTGVAPFSYVWSNTSTTEDLSTLCPGMYSVTTTDANGCVSVISTSISQPELLTITPVTVTFISNNGAADGAIDIDVNGGTAPYTYQWIETSNPLASVATSQDLSGLVKGTYRVTATDANGCKATFEAKNFIDKILIQLVDKIDALCGTPGGEIEVSVSGGVPPYQLIWSHGQTSMAVTGLAVGKQTVVVTDALGTEKSKSYRIKSGISWSSALGLQMTTETIIKTGLDGWSNAYATSTNMIGSFEVGSFNYTLDGLDGDKAIGFTSTSGNNDHLLMDAAFVIEGTKLFTSSKGTPMVALMDITGSEKLTIKRDGDQIIYKVDGKVKKQETIDPSTPLWLNVFVKTQFARLDGIQTSFCESEMTTSFETVNIVGDQLGSTAVSVKGGVFPYSYTWYENFADPIGSSLRIAGPSKTESTIYDKEAGIYAVLVTDAIGTTMLMPVGISEEYSIEDISGAVTINGGTIKKNGKKKWGNANMTLNELVNANDGATLFFEIGNTKSQYAIGIRNENVTRADDYSSMYYGVFVKNDELSIIEGGVVSSQFKVKKGDLLSIEKKGEGLSIRKNEAVLNSTSAISVSVGRIDVAINTGKIVKVGIHVFEPVQPLSRGAGSMTDEISSGYLLVSSCQLKFKFREEYNPIVSTLKYQITNLRNNAVVANSNNASSTQLDAVYGSKIYQMVVEDFTTTDGTFLLEVWNQKGEVQYMKFKVINIHDLNCF